MKREIARRGSGICAAAATAMSAVGISLASASMLPVAHAACEDWILGPTVWEIALDNGVLIETYGWSGKSMTTTPGGKPAFAEWFPAGGGDKTEGPSSGSINRRAINFTANWVTGPGAGGPDTFNGKIDDNGVASGKTIPRTPTFNDAAVSPNFGFGLGRILGGLVDTSSGFTNLGMGTLLLALS